MKAAENQNQAMYAQAEEFLEQSGIAATESPTARKENTFAPEGAPFPSVQAVLDPDGRSFSTRFVKARAAGKVVINTLKFVHRTRAERDYLLSTMD